MFKTVIQKIGFTKMLLVLLSLFFVLSSISGLVLYKILYTPLGPHFAAAYQNITRVQDNLLFSNILINLIFYSITALGVLFLGILYSHRIAGPLVKVTQFTKMIGKGEFSQRINFRKKDAIHSFSTALNEMAQANENNCNNLYSNLNQLEQHLNMLKSIEGDSKEKAACIDKIHEIDASISKAYKGLIL